MKYTLAIIAILGLSANAIQLSSTWRDDDDFANAQIKANDDDDDLVQIKYDEDDLAQAMDFDDDMMA